MDPAAAPAAIRRARLPYTAALCVFTALAVGLMASGAWSLLTWLGVPVLEVPWADLRPLTGANVAIERGLDPMFDNPGDPWGRPFNYPRVWLVLPRLGLTAADTPWLAAVMLLALSCGLWALRPLVTSRRAAWLLAAGALAPTTWLGVERANTALLMFALVAGAAALATTRRATASIALGVAAVLKLYPIVAAAALLDEHRRTTLRVALPLGLAFIAYTFWIRNDLGPIRAGATHAPWLAYGLELLPTLLSKNTGLNAPSAFAAAGAALLATACVALLARRRGRLGAAGTASSLAGFRAGAAVYLGTFLLGHNFDYRLLMLLPTLPQLATWTMQGSGASRRLATASVTAVLALQWGMSWRAGLTAAIGDATAGVLLDELLSWGLWAGMAWLFAATLPDWLLPRRWRDAPLLDSEPSAPLEGPSPASARPSRPRRTVGSGA
ncbi:MAG: hypothetical protein H6835_06390 [Planctomycetes bacterium]|nr:hypothetical protein [Planctomycetota bacterium]